MGHTKKEKDEQGPRYPGVEGADGESKELVIGYVEAEDAGGHVVVAYRHPGPADSAAHQVHGKDR